MKWLTATWEEILQLTQMSRIYRGNTTYWIEVKFNDDRKKLRIGQSIEGYADLRKDSLRTGGCWKDLMDVEMASRQRQP